MRAQSKWQEQPRVREDRSQRMAALPSHISGANRRARALWQLVWLLLYRPSPVRLFGWRRFLLRCFGAQVGVGAYPYPRTRIWAPWNLTLGAYSCLANDVDCYCVAPVELGAYATVSQYSYLCTASHDYQRREMPLVSAPIVLGRDSWVAADAFVGPGVTIAEGAVVAARATVVRNVPAWSVVGGNPAREIAARQPFPRP
jgi:putative colanic acid biosynthesis acetyltransferase WcaF